MKSNETAFARMRDSFLEAHSQGDGECWESTCQFGGKNGRFRIAGSECAARIIPTFRHLLGENGSLPGLTIDIWDALETGVSFPEFPGFPEILPGDERTSSEYGLIIGDATSRFIGCYRPGMFSWMDRSSQHIVACTPDAGRLELYERAKPLLFPLMMWHCDHDTDIIHAALVERGGQGVLFAGRGGTGKSTAALACLEAGFTYLGDDYIGLQALGNDSFIGHSLYGTAWLEPDNASRFPALKPHIMKGTLPKLPVVLSDVYPDQVGQSAEIRFILLPRLTNDTQSSIQPALPRDVVMALAPTSLIKRPCSGASGFDKITRMAEQVPAWFVDMGSDLKHLAAVVEGLVSSGAGS